MTDQISQSKLQVQETSMSIKAAQEFQEALIESFKKQSIIYQIRKRREERKKKEFLGRLKYGKRYHRTDDPGPF